MKFTKRSATNVAVSVALLMAGLVGSPANAEDPAQEFEQLREIKPPEGYVLHDIKECPQGARTLALAIPDPRERDLHRPEHRFVLLLLNEEGEPKLEIGPENFDLEIYSLATVSWLGDGESFVFVASPPLEPDPELLAQSEEIKEEIEHTDPEEERDRYIELAQRGGKLQERVFEHKMDTRDTTTLFRCDAARGEIEQLRDINERVWEVDVDGDDHIHVALADDRHVQVLTPDGEHVTSHAIPFPDTVGLSYETPPHLDASSQTVWTNRSVTDLTKSSFSYGANSIVRLCYGGEELGEEFVLEFDQEEEKGYLKEIAPSGAAVLYETLAADSEDRASFVYDVETVEHTRVPTIRDLVGDDRSLAVESVSLAREGAAVRYKVKDLQQRGMNPVEIWQSTALYEYTLPE